MDGLEQDLAALSALLQAPPEDDSVRELYGELVDRYRDDPDSLAKLRPFGDQIRQLEADGRLPSTLVVRAPRARGPGR
ncbi:MAG: hypothetical protein JO257_28825 [Deltaproteobacteria bacterium]|nr:hypothetical protein [Deltaproteobacteria bacterium]